MPKDLLSGRSPRDLLAGSGSTSEPSQVPKARRGVVENLVDSFTGGAAYTFGDEITAAEAALLGKTPEGGIFNFDRPFSERYDRALEAERAQNKAFQQEHPVLSTTAEVAGLIASPVNRVLPGVGGARTLREGVKQGAKQGAAIGGLFGAGSGEGLEDRLTKAAVGTGLGALTGAGAGAVAGKFAQNRAVVPSNEALRQQAGNAYEIAEQAGVIVSGNSFQRFSSRLQQKMAEEGIDATIHPKAMAALKRILTTNGNVTLKGTEILRRVVKESAKSTDPAERRLGSIMLNEIDDYVQKLGADDLIAGKAASETAKAALTQARSLWSRVRRSDAIEELITRARDRSSQFSGSGFENALRTEFRRVLLNKRLLSTFNKAEQEAIRKVARGGPIENATRMLGKFHPNTVISAGIGGAAGYAIGGPVGAVALPAVGGASRLASRFLTNRNARLAAELARQGGPLITPGNLTPIQARLAEALISGGAPQLQNAVAAPRFNLGQ